MVVASKQVAECIERLGFSPLRQFIRPPRPAHPARRAVAVTFGKQNPPESQAPLGGDRLTPGEAVTRRGIALLLPQARLSPPAHEAHAWPVRVVRNESGVPVELRVGVGVTEQEPLDEL